MKPADKPIALPGIVLQEGFGDWGVLYDPESARAVGVNPVGIAVWQHLDGHHTLADIAALVGRAFSSTPDNILDEIGAFVEQLAEVGFVRYE